MSNYLPPHFGDEPDQNDKACLEFCPNYFDWNITYPELSILIEHIEDIKEEAFACAQWQPWPENHYSQSANNTKDWTVYPFLHTFPAMDITKKTWIEPTCRRCPKTVAILETIPNIRTALFSRLGGGTRLSSHTGWADLANYVLRCHVSLKIPTGRHCGTIVNGEVQYHEPDSILIFDDSKSHSAFNDSTEQRIVLIVDVLRPSDIPLGRAVGGHTKELDKFVSIFR